MKSIVSVSVIVLSSAVGVFACSSSESPSTLKPSNAEDNQTSAGDGKTASTQDAGSTNSSSSGSSGSSGSSSGSSSSSSSSSTSSSSGSSGIAATCVGINGSCKTAVVCNDYSGGNIDQQKSICDTLKGDWSTDACDRTDSVGGCKNETKTTNLCVSVVSWFFAPLTADDVPKSCTPPGVVITP